jgi:hypothetical protein
MLLLATLYGCGTCWDLRSHGIRSGECPSSELRLALSVDASDLRRGAVLPDPQHPDGELPAPEQRPGRLTVRTELQWLSGDGSAASHQAAPYSGDATITAALVDREDQAVPVALGPFTVEDGQRRAAVALPEVPDGDYRLRVEVETEVDRATADVPLALYAPALVHVMSDRPLLRPGETVHLRSLVMRRDDLTPLGDRPGRWQVVAPDGVEVLTETDTAGPWGVADTSLPLHPDAAAGSYRAIYTSGADRDEVRFEVRPFALPRLTAEVAPVRAWFGVGDELAVQGTARYGSGAPVAGATVTVTLRSSSGSWPPPTAWEAPIELRTGPDGTFRAAWGAVPADLIERATLAVDATVREEGGETIVASSALVLSKRTLQVEAVTELDDGLVGGVNNRAYLRVTTPDGAPLAGARVAVVNPWDPRMAPKVGDADEDGVVALQLDPGDPVTLVDPAPPVRRPVEVVTDPARPRLVRGTELGGKRDLSLAERKALDRAPELLMPCREAEAGDGERTVALQVASSGSVVGAVPSGADATTACVAERLRGLRLPAGTERTLVVTFQVPDSERPYLTWEASDVIGHEDVGDAVTAAVEAAGDAARSCLSPGRGPGLPVIAVHWRVRAERQDVEVRVGPLDSHGLPDATVACLTRGLGRIRLAEAPEHDGLGVIVGRLQGGSAPADDAPEPVRQATTTTGYELQVTAASAADGRPLGEGRVRFAEGRIPPLRIRATPSVVAPGGRVTVELLRGPDATIELPEALALTSETGARLAEAELDGNTAVFEVPADARGFLSVRHAGVTSHLWVQRPDRLAVSLSTDQPAYRPGETARLTVRTVAGAGPTSAAVGLSGVDAALGRIAALPGADDYGRVTVRATSASAPFGTFDARALLLGRIRGRNAAQAAVQRIVPPSPVSSAAGVAGGTGSVRPDEAGVLAAAFGRAYPAALRRVRAWEEAAADGDTFDNDAMAAIWTATLAELRGGEPVVDVWGRELTLPRLPPDLLAQLDPRQMLHDGTHLPEDLVAWALYVSRSE